MTDFRAKATEDFKDLRQAFNAHGIPFFAVFGTALGAVRENGFIEHDDDIDLAIINQYTKEEKEAFHEDLKKMGFDVTHQPYKTDSRTLTRRKILTGIHWLVDDGYAYILRHANGDPMVRIPLKYIPALEQVKFLDGTILVPSPPDVYLAAAYGISWRRPIKNRHTNPVME